MIELLTNPVVAAAVFTIIGGILLKVVETWLNRDSAKIVSRKDYREEIAGMQVRMDTLESEISGWREAFYEMQVYTATLRAEMATHGIKVDGPPPGPPDKHVK